MKKILFAALLLLSVGFGACERGGEQVKTNNISLSTEDIVAKAEGENIRFTYSVQSPSNGTTLEVTCDAEWVSDIVV